jgi:polygalacturonase
MRYLLFLLAGVAAAQDLRNVTEPRLPGNYCATLEARFSREQDTELDTGRVQNAIDGCAAERAVRLVPRGDKRIFLIAPIHLKTGVTLVVDAGAAVFGSRNPRDYDISPGSCGVVNKQGHGCQPLILVDHAPYAGIMGDGSIDGRGGAKLLGQNVTWWDLAHEAKVTDQQQSCPRILVVRQSDNFTLYRIVLRNSPNFHVSVDRSNGFTAWGVKILTPRTARNTDGIDPSSSSNVTITHSFIATGDDNVAIKAGGNGPSKHITVADNHFYSGHGMSIGSETNGGVSAIRVRNLTIDGADNGIRIKSDRSRGGLVEDVIYENVCLREVKNPIVLTTAYTNLGGGKIPVYRHITLRDVSSVTPGTLTIAGVDAEHKLAVALDNVFARGKTIAAHADIKIGPRAGDFIPAGDDLTVDRVGVSAGHAVDCAFPPFPGVDGPAANITVPAEDHAIYVAADGTGEFSSVQRAIDSAPEGGLISIAPGVYREVLTISKPHLQLRGGSTDPSRVVVVFNKSAGDSNGTFNSATVNVRADDFDAANLTFANDWNATHEQIAQGSQALALSVTADRARFRNVRLLGNQDTLYLGSQGCSPGNGEPCTVTRQYFENCYIEGNVDFIFGDGKAWFENCEIHSTPHQGGYITAQGKHYASEDSAFVFDHCRLTAAAGVRDVWLGRPWRPWATVTFANTEMGDHIATAGWREWHPGETNYIETSSSTEYRSYGPGAHPSEREPHTRLLDSFSLTVKQFFGDWDPRWSGSR